ncbi:WD repeat and HMG-box DNA binding-domain containing protein 1 [Entomophthora muscae]|uniref:WD repeat and HMG-box DNA binding-domain containing protein 1 n=1 Tax=Entomophthora muscae TaxID=34485 RepID=A0ACC2RGX5_9FUNG|nr:WD repeat and HMG-box DNA binding-domain containing protein 1 [Entomophthora muscae]
MAIDKRPTIHSAHCEGHTSVAFSVDGRNIFTAGCDNLIRSFDASSESRTKEAKTLNCHSSPITSLVTTADYLITASEDMVVRRIDVKTFEPSQPLVHSSQNVHGLVKTDTRKHGPCKVGVLADGTIIKVADVKTKEGTILTGLPHPAISAAFDPDGKGVVALTTMGSLVRWELTSTSSFPTLIKQSAARTSDLKEPCEIAMHPTGQFLAVPASRQGHVKIIDPRTLEEIQNLPFGHDKMVSLIQWSPNGQFLATCGQDQLLTIWKVNTWTKCLVLEIPAAATSMAWSPTRNMLALATDLGGLMVFDQLLSSIHGAGKHDWATVVDLDQLSETDDIDDFMRQDAGKELDLSLEELSLEDVPVALQSSFTPGSTQMETSDWQFLTYNSVGGILANNKAVKPLYSVKFHDKEKYSDYQFSDLRRYTLASISAHGALFAMQGYLFYRPHADPDPRSTWEALLPPGEDVLAVVATPRGPIICTSRGHARFFTCLGLQYQVSTLPSPTLLSMASDQADRLLYVYHRGAEPANLRLGYSLFDLGSMQVLGRGALTLSPGAALEWVGFSQDGIPACSDSEGLVQVLANPSAVSWLPVLRIDPGQLFPFSVERGQLFCLRISSDPSWIEHPLIRQIPWQATPVITRHGSREESDFLLARLETQLESGNLPQRHLIEDRLLLSLINGACKADRQKQAIELAMMLNRLESFCFAEKIVLSHGMEDALSRIKQIHAVKASLVNENVVQDAELTEQIAMPLQQTKRHIPSVSPEPLPRKQKIKEKSSNPFAVSMKHGTRPTSDRPPKRLPAADYDDLDMPILKTPVLKTPKATILASPHVIGKNAEASPMSSNTLTPNAKRPARQVICNLPISDDSD